MNKAEEFNNILMQLPLMPHERAYFMTRFYENEGFLDAQDHADLSQRIQDAIEDTENTISDYDWILEEITRDALLERIDIALEDSESAKNSIQVARMEFEDARLQKEIDTLQKQYDEEIAHIRSKNLPHDQERAQIANLDEKYISQCS